MTDSDLVRHDRGTITDGPTVGLASYQLSDPESTFRMIERTRPRPIPRPPGAGSWALRFLLTWAVNLVALAAAGIVVTSVGAYDPFAYVAWAAVFGAAGTSVPVAARVFQRSRAVLIAAAALVLVDVALVSVMTVLARPFHSPALVDIAKVGAVMWAVNLPLGVLYLKRRAPAPRRRPA